MKKQLIKDINIKLSELERYAFKNMKSPAFAHQQGMIIGLKWVKNLLDNEV